MMMKEMINKFEEMAVRNGNVTVDEKKYILLEQAVFQADPIRFTDNFNEYYEASAICLDDEEDEDGYMPRYRITWEILDGYNPECGDESLACDWDAPEEIKEIGGYDVETGIMF